MGIAPLTVAAIAGALLFVSVLGDLAFTQSVTLEAGKAGGDLTLLGRSSVDGRATSVDYPEPIAVNRSDELTFRVRFENGHPWSASRTFLLSPDGCGPGSRTFAVLDVAAPARGTGSASVDIGVDKLLNATGYRSPKPVGAEDQPIYLTLCKGEKYTLSATLPLREVPS